MKSQDSVFFGQVRAKSAHFPVPINDRRVLVVQRKDENQSIYLPGGGVQAGLDRTKSLMYWLERQTSLELREFWFCEMWKLSNGSEVLLLRASPAKGRVDEVGLSEKHLTKFTSAIWWANRHQLIEYYLSGRMPWAQFKMAMYMVEEHSRVAEHDLRSGSAMKGGFVDHDEVLWQHPSNVAFACS